MSIESHRDLLVWQRSMDLLVRVYELSKLLPVEERFGLVSQLRRAACSVPANIAEGKARETTKFFLNFLSIADGSLAELDTHVEAAVRLGYISREQQRPLMELMSEVGRMHTAFRRSLKRKLA